MTKPYDHKAATHKLKLLLARRDLEAAQQEVRLLRNRRHDIECRLSVAKRQVHEAQDHLNRLEGREA